MSSFIQKKKILKQNIYNNTIISEKNSIKFIKLLKKLSLKINILIVDKCISTTIIDFKQNFNFSDFKSKILLTFLGG